MKRAEAIVRADGKVYGYAVHCPGCGHAHIFNVAIPGEENKPGRPCWTFNGDVDRPTFSPSMLTWITESDGKRGQVCHSFVRDGRFEYLSDTTAHALRGFHDVPEFGGETSWIADRG